MEGVNQGSPNPIIQQFCSITGADEHIAANLLEACGNNLEMAIGMHMDGGGTAAEPAPPDGASTSAAQPAPPVDVDEIRAPIPQRTEVLVEGNAGFGLRGRRRAVRSVFDGFRDFQAEAREMECAGGAGAKTRSKRKTLEELFRPPLELLFHGSFQAARTAGTNSNRWLLVNVQDVHEFICQALNRDVWSNAMVKQIVKSKFILWQVYADSEEGQRYMQFYNVPDWPYIAILDPRTGEKMMVWHKVDGATLTELLNSFLEEHPSPDGSIAEPCPELKLKKDSIVDASEESQMEAAIQASLHDLASATSKDGEDSDDYGSSDEIETFSGSDDDGQTHTRSNGSSPRKTPTKNGQNNTQRDKTLTKCKRSPSPAKCLKSSQEQNAAAGSTHKTNFTENDKHKNTLSPTQAAHSKCSRHSPPRKEAVQGTSSLFDPSPKRPSTSEESSAQKRRKSEDGTVADIGSNLHKSWKEYLGAENDPKSNLIIRFPDGNRQQLSLPCTSMLMAVLRYVAEAGYPSEKYEVVTTFPKRKLSQMDSGGTLKDLGLYPQDTIFVQET